MDDFDINELISLAISLDLTSLSRLCRTSNNMAKLCRNDNMWYMKVVKDFGNIIKDHKLTWKQVYKNFYDRKLYTWFVGDTKWQLNNINGIISASSSYDGDDKIIAFIAANGNFYTYGSDSHGRHGHAVEDVTEPTLIKDINAAMVSCGGTLTAVVTIDNRLVLMGYEYPKPTYLQNFKVSMVSCGFGHCGFVTTNGDLYMFGDADNNLLGINADNIPADEKIGLTFDSYIYVTVPQLIKSNVRLVSCGNYISAYITNDDQLYGIIKIRYEPNNVLHYIADNVKDVKCGAEHILYLDNNNNLYGLLNNFKYPMLRTDLPEYTLDPVYIYSNIVMFSCGGYGSAAINADGQLFTNVDSMKQIPEYVDNIYDMDVSDDDIVIIGKPRQSE